MLHSIFFCRPRLEIVIAPRAAHKALRVASWVISFFDTETFGTWKAKQPPPHPIHKIPNLYTRMGGVFGSPATPEERVMAISKVKQIVSSDPVVVFSKTYCGYCKRVKQLLLELNASYKLLELDEESDGGEIQSALAEWTGQRTVPNVFIGGKHMGGCDDVTAMHKQGKLIPLLNEVGAVAKPSSEPQVKI